MGFLLQLRILLWKNLTLKKRTPKMDVTPDPRTPFRAEFLMPCQFVLMFEVFIPLVLFFILVAIRAKQPASPMGARTFHAVPLPSSGIIAIMQAFCDGGHRDKDGFLQYPNSSVENVLRLAKNVAKQNNFFNPGFEPEDMDKIPGMYREIIDDPVMIHDAFMNAKDFTFASIVKNQKEFVRFLVQNLSMPADEARALINVTVDFKEVYRLIFGSAITNQQEVLKFLDHQDRRRKKRDVGDMFSNIPDKVSHFLNRFGSNPSSNKPAESAPGHSIGGIFNRRIKDFQRGLLYHALLTPGTFSGLDREEMAGLMEQVLGLKNHDNDDLDTRVIVDMLKHILFSPSTLHSLACNKEELHRLFKPSNESAEATLNKTEDFLCAMNDSQLNALSRELNEVIKTNDIIMKLNVTKANITEARKRMEIFSNNLNTFVLFEKTLMELSELAKHLPLDSCPTDADAMLNFTTISPTEEANTTTTTPPPTAKGHKDKGKYSGLLQIWMAMQQTVCGRQIITKEKYQEYQETMDLGKLGLNKNIGILVHVLYSNPKVLYAPNNTNADKIIRQANETFALLDKVSEYARKWLNTSSELRDYLMKNSTTENLQKLKEIQREMQQMNISATLDSFLHANSTNDKIDRAKKMKRTLPFMKHKFDKDIQILHTFMNITIPDTDVFLNQLDIVDNAACSWLSLVKGISLNMFKGFKTEDELVNYALDEAYFDNVTVFASVVFQNLNKDGSLPPHIVYKIRQNASMTETTKQVRPKYWFPGPKDWGYQYYQMGFVWIQDVIERAIIDTYVGHDVVEPGSYFHQFPYPCFMADQFLFMIEHVMPLCLTISWVYSVAMLVQSIVYEKEQRLKEVMKMMGLNNAVHWCAWFITSCAQMTVTMGILTLMLKYGKVLTYSNPLLIFLVLEVFAVATILFSFFVSVLYSKAKVAAACAGIVYFLSYVPYMYVAIREEAAGDHISAWAKSIASLFSTTAFGLGAKYFAYYEVEGVGVQWDNIASSPVEADQYNLFSVALMMIIDSIVYGLLVWYIEAVHPGSYGLPKPWYFPFTKSYWFGHAIKTESEQCSITSCCFKRAGLSVIEEDQACAMEQRDADHPTNFEPEPSHLREGVCIENLSKVYKSGKLAVNKLSLNLYEGQITSFLGHNGAGKTTTMSILTGLFPPSAGYAIIYGLDIRTDMEEIRKSLGFCPQHNVLFDKLTVEEHLWFYARLKGMESRDIAKEMESMIEDVGLPKKRQSTVDCLSGGMQRKLSVAIAFVAGSRTVILDEPTAGVDPYARRAIWDLLIKYKQGRTILLSTHHMEEADLLGDRIAIISNGQLKCCGSSLYLKSVFGDGYLLTLAKKQKEEDVQSTDTFTADDQIHFNDSTPTFVSKCSAQKVTEFINTYISTAYHISESNRELRYILPFEELKKGNFQKFFDAFDAAMQRLHIDSYGVMDTTLEEVFLKVTERARAEDRSSSSNTSSPEHELKPVENTVLDQVAMTPSPEPTELPELDNNSMTNLLIGADNASITSPRFRSRDSRDSSPQHGDYMLLTNEDDEERAEIDGGSQGQGQMHDQYTLLENMDPTFENCLNNEGAGSYHVTGNALRIRQFYGVIVKRFFYIRRNWKGLFSQILLPALFVCIAMTVALTAPRVQDLPELVLSPAQYYNYTQPRGNFIPFANKCYKEGCQRADDAGPQKIIDTFKISGSSATCVLKSPDMTPPEVMEQLKDLDLTGKWRFLSQYFEPDCRNVYVKGFHLENFVPPSSHLLPSEVNTSKLDLEALDSPDPKYYPNCECAPDGRGFNCPAMGFQHPPDFRVITSDIFQDVSTQDESQFYLNTNDEYRLHRYGALSLGAIRHYVPADFGRNAPSIFRRLAVRNVAKVHYNNRGYHAMPAYLNMINNAILRANMPPEKGNPAAYGITVINHPMNNTNNQLTMEYILQGSDVLISIFIIVAMSFVPASFVLFLVYERSIKAKHLQFVSGINPVIYWVANYVWDMCNYMVPGVCCIIILRVFDIPAYVSATNFPATISLFLMYGWSITPMMYPASFWFKEPSTAYICLIVANLFIGITCIVTSFLLELFSYDSDLNEIHKMLKVVFLMFPNYCLGRGLMDIAFNEYHNEFYFKTGQYDKMKSPFEWDLMARNLVAMAAVGLIFFIFTLLCEFRFFMKSKHLPVSKAPVPNEDRDVTSERRRVLRGSGRRDLLRLENITKIYKTKKLGRHLAVDRLCLGVPEGECFGLLGVNGAGKTTTFKMLTGDILPTGGNVWLDGHSILSDLLKVQQKIGYCPQFDALYDELTAREHLQLYARLRGIPRKEESGVVDWALRKLSLLQYADKPSKTYSGGNKRKLSTAIALIGHPPVILMDEPTTGMDPHSRRFLWDLILNLIKSGRSVILSSHSMEECEALCSRLAIMVNGEFKCLGSTQHLKSRFGEGYTVTARAKGPNHERELDAIKRFIERNFSDAVYREEHYNMVQYELHSNNLSLSRVFSKMEEMTDDLQVEDYSVCQNTLDNVFINFVKKQSEIVREIEDTLDIIGATPQPTTAISHRNRSRHPESLEDSDDELLDFDQPGTRLAFINMDNVVEV